ncbi:MAG: hypothetical protein EBY39_14905 [Flavobacteriia bacterium]|nr:hypothetical protein [Flavobacteriia bacterium]
MIIRTDRKTEMDYRLNEAVSQSKLKYLLKGVSVYNTVDEIIDMLFAIDCGNKPIDSDRWRLLQKEYR